MGAHRDGVRSRGKNALLLIFSAMLLRVENDSIAEKPHVFSRQCCCAWRTTVLLRKSDESAFHAAGDRHNLAGHVPRDVV